VNATRSTIVSVHAHPDDEVLLTGGSLARWHAEGHRTVVVIATDGAEGLASSRFGGPTDLATARAAELERACRCLGVDRVVRLGHPDSGSGGPAPADSFARRPLLPMAARLAQILRDESADVVTGYDAAGGYGHRDHVQVHRLVMVAAELAETPLVLQATVDRRPLQRALRIVARLPGTPPTFTPDAFDAAFADPRTLTHRVDVRAYADRKRAALAAHASQATADRVDRTLAWSLRLPRPLFRRVFGYEWFVEVGRAPGRPLCDDALATLATTDDAAAVGDHAAV
jgi:LmbE family N-acetylglucosaminyl deacetylase